MKPIYSQFCEAKGITEVNQLLEKYLYQVPGNQRAKLYQTARHARTRIEHTK